MIEEFALITEKGTELSSEASEFANAQCPTFLESSQLSDAAMDAKVEAAAHSACHFFDMPDATLEKGDSIGVIKDATSVLNDDTFVYNLEQFKQMNCTSFEDMTKIWSHECGHRLLQDIIPNSWADELGSDFFAGARSEMLGLPKGNFEEYLASTNASQSHPGGELRIKAMEFGRQVVADMKANGVAPTWQNCIEKFCNSPFAQMNFENAGNLHSKATSFVDDKAWHLKNAQSARETAEWYNKRANNALEKGDLGAAKDYSRTAQMYENQAKEETKTAQKCTKLVEAPDVYENRAKGGSYGDLKREGWGWNDQPPHEIHHMPSNESSHLETADGPCIAMDYEDHRKTASCGNSRDAKEYRSIQKELIDSGDFRQAMQMDIDDIHEKFGGKYDAHISQMLVYVENLDNQKRI